MKRTPAPRFFCPGPAAAPNGRGGWRRRAAFLAGLLLFSIPDRLPAAGKEFVLSGATVQLEDLSTHLGVYYQAMRLNRAAGVWNVEVSFTNASQLVLQGPFILEIESFFGTSGPMQPDGRDGSAPARAFYDLSGFVRNGVLPAGAVSNPRTLTLGYTSGTPRLVARVFGKGTASAVALAVVRSLNEVGQPLPGTAILETGPRGRGDVLTDPSYGWATLGQGAGEHTWQFSATNHLPVWRRQSLLEGEVAVLPNPRLVRRSSQGVAVTPLGGQAASGDGSIRLTFAPGVVAHNCRATLTPLTGQSLPAFLPLGWSPLQAFWLELEPQVQGGVGFAALSAPAMAVLIPWGPLAAGEKAGLVAWNESALQWTVLAIVGGGGTNALSVQLPRAGAYAVVVGDSGDGAPPALQVGQALSAGTVSLPDFAKLTASGTVDPTASAASRVPELVTATATVIITNRAGPLPSGLRLRGDVSESYRLRDGSHRHPPQYENFMVGYQRPGDDHPATLHAAFPMRPLLFLSAEELDTATVKVDVLVPGPFTGGVLDATGGQVVQDGARLLAGVGDITNRQAVQLRQLDPTNFLELGTAGYSVVQAMDLSLGQVAPNRRLAVQFSAVPTNRLFVLARVVYDSGLYGLEPRERLRSDGAGQLASLEPSSGARLPGITGAGQYVLLSIDPAQALVSGIAKNSSGQPAAGLPVRVTGQRWLTLSANDGSFQLIAPAGDATVTVSDLATGDSGSQMVHIPNPQTPVNTQLASESSGPRVVSVSPADQATSVARVTTVVVEFGKSLNPATLLGGGLSLRDASKAPVSASVTLSLRGNVATLLPANPLAASTRYTITLSTNLSDLAGRKLEGTKVFSFTTESDPLRRPAADLVIYEPTNGLARMTGGAGMAEPNAPVILVNESSGATATVLSKPDGSFDNFIAAGADDELSAVLVNGNGTRNTVFPERQIFRDGSVGLFETGGVVETATEHGVMQFAVDPGAIAGRVKYKLQPVPAAQVTALLTNVPLEPEVKLLGGFTLSQEGDDPTVGPHVAFPIDPAGLGLPLNARPEDASFVLAIPVETEDGSTVFHVVDRMYFTNGALRTFSPPFKGSILKFFIDNLISGKRLSPATKILNLLGLPSLQDVVIHQLMLPMMIAQGTSQTIFGDVVSVQADAGGGIVSGSQRPVPGAIITVTRDDQSSGRAGRLKPGGIFTSSDGRGHYALAVAANKLEQPGFVGSTTHPAFPFQRPSVGTVLGSLAAQLRTTSVGVQMDFFFQRVSVPNAPGPDETPPQIRITVEPRDPLPGTNTQEGATITVAGFDDQSLAELNLSLADFKPFSNQTNPPPPVLTAIPGSQQVLGPAAVQQSFRLTSKLRGEVRLRATASDDAGHLREMTTIVSIAGDRIFPGNTNDTVGPRVLFTLPPDGAQGLAPGVPVTVQFSEPVNAALLADPTPWLTLANGKLASVQLSPDARTLSIFFTPDASAPVTFTINSHLTDANTNDFDQLPGQAGSQSHTWTAGVLNPNVLSLGNLTSGGGVVVQGRYAFALERRPGGAQNAGAVFIYDLAGSSASKVGEIPLAGPARDLALIPNYSFKIKPGDACQTADLLAVVGGSISADSPFQFLRIFNVTDPLQPVRIAGSTISLNIAAITKVQWAPPWILYLESGADLTDVGIIDLQTYIIGMSASGSEINQFPINGQPGTDLNGDGDYCDLNEITPLPIRSPTEFFGKEFAVLADPPETNSTRRILDFDFDPESGLFGITVSGGALRDANGQPTGPSLPPYYRTVATRSAQLDPAPASLTLPLGTRPKRVALFSGVQLAGTTNVLFRSLAIVSLADVSPPRLAVVDITDPLHPSLLKEVRLTGVGIPQTLQRRDDGLLAVGTSDDMLLFDPAKLLLEPAPGGNLPAWVGIIRGASAGANSFAAGPDGATAVNLGSKHEVHFTAPSLRIVAFPNRTPMTMNQIVALSDQEKYDLLAGGEVRTRLLRTRFFDSSTNQSLLPLSTNSHYYVRVDAVGSLGSELELVLEGINGAGEPIRAAGSGQPPGRLASSSTLQQLGETNTAPAFPTSLRAKQLSTQKGSPLHGIYLAGPFTITGRGFSPSQATAIQSQLARAILTAGRALWIGFDPTLAPDPYPGSILSSVAQPRLVPGSAVYVQVDAPPLPTVFIPGVAGSHLNKIGFVNIERWPGLRDSGKDDLSLKPNVSSATIVASDILRMVPEPYGLVGLLPDRTLCSFPRIYDPLIHFMTYDMGLLEYDYLKLNQPLRCEDGGPATSAQEPDKMAKARTLQAWDETQIARQPNLFVFPYDWRFGIESTVTNLSEYLEVVKRFHPEAEQINIVAHSMGGLVARRFILDHAGVVNKLITLGSPWLGAPKAINAMETGEFLDTIQHILVISKPKLKELIEYFPGPQQLVPSLAYFNLAGSPFVDNAGDLPGNTNGSALTFPQFQHLMDDIYHPDPQVKPVKVSDDFHKYQGSGQDKQDDWQNDKTGVQYFHVAAIQSDANTIGKVVSRWRIRPAKEQPNELFELKREFALEYTWGDGTVPVFSSLRVNNSQNLNAPNARLYPLVATSTSQDKVTDHNGMLANTNLQQLVRRILEDDIPESPPLSLPSGIVTYVVRMVNAEKNELLVSASNPGGGSGATSSNSQIAHGTNANEILLESGEENVPGLQIEEPDTNIVDAVLNGSFEIKAGYDGRPISLRVEEQVDGVPQTVYLWRSLDPSDFPSNAPSDFEAIVTINSPPLVTVKDGGNAVPLPPDEVIFGAAARDHVNPTLNYQFTNACQAIVFTMVDNVTSNVAAVFVGDGPFNVDRTAKLRIFRTNVVNVSDLLAIAVTNQVHVTAQDVNGNVAVPIVIDLFVMNFHLDAAGTKALEDWPAVNGKPRSAKTLLNTEDQVFITLLARPGQGDNAFRVSVKSESDTIGRSFRLQEAASGVYKNLSSQEVLRFVPLDPNASVVTGVEIKDEELVKFELFNAAGSSPLQCDLMVDLGELAVATLNHTDRRISDPSLSAFPRYEFQERFFTAADGFHMASAGFRDNFDDNVGAAGPGLVNDMGRFIINFADPALPNMGEADVLYIHCHGSRTGALLDHSSLRQPIIQPEIDILGSGLWNRDADFVILDACATLNPGLNDDRTPSGRPSGFTNWLNTIRGSSRPVHGILGFAFPKTARLRPAYRNFMGELQAGTSIPTAWGDSMTDAGMPWALLWYLDNLDDTIRTLTQDPTPSNTIRYAEFTGIFSTTCEDQAELPKPLVGDFVPVSPRISLARGVVSAVAPAQQLPRTFQLQPLSVVDERMSAAGSVLTRPTRQSYTPLVANAVLALTATNQTTAGLAATDYLVRQFAMSLGSLQQLGVGEIRSCLLTNHASASPIHETYVAIYRQLIGGMPVDGSLVRVDLTGSVARRVMARGLVTPATSAPAHTFIALNAWDALSRHLAELDAAVPATEQWIVEGAELVWIRNPESEPGPKEVPDAAVNFVPAWRFGLRTIHNGESAGAILLHAVDGKPLRLTP